MDRVSDIFESLLNNPTIEENLQERIFSFGVKNNQALVVRLAKHKDLKPYIDGLIRATGSAEILAAWASRSDRTLDEIKNLIAEERRGTVLEQLAANTEIGVEAIKQLSEVSSQNVMFQLLENTSTPEDVKKEVITKLSGVFRKNSYDSKRRFVDIIKKNPSLASSVLASSMTDNVYSLIFETTANLAVEDQLKLVYLIKASLEKELEDYQEGWRISTMINSLAYTLANTDCRDAIRDEYPATHNNSSIQSALRELSHKVSLYDNNVSEKLAEQAASNDTALTANLVDRVITGTIKDFQEETCSILFSNHTLTPADTAKLLSYRRYKTEWDKVINRDDTLAIFEELITTDPTVAGELLSHIREKNLRIEMIELTLEVSRKNSINLPTWFRKITEMHDYIDKVPMSFIDNHTLGSYPKVRKWYDEKIIDRLQGDNQKWELFATFSQKFEGTLDELLNTIDSLAV